MRIRPYARSYDGGQAEDVIGFRDEEPPWVDLLSQFQVEGLDLLTEDVYGEHIALQTILFE